MPKSNAVRFTPLIVANDLERCLTTTMRNLLEIVIFSHFLGFPARHVRSTILCRLGHGTSLGGVAHAPLREIFFSPRKASIFNV